MADKIIQVSGFGVENNSATQCSYLLCALTDCGKVLLSTGDGKWHDVSPKVDSKAEVKDYGFCTYGSTFPCNPACENGCV